MTAEEALRFFDRLVEAARAEKRASAERELEQLSPPDLRLLARELGLPGGKRVSRRSLLGSIAGRISESLMLSKNVNLTQPLSASIRKTPSDDPERR
jgi:hypothetical protein